MNLNSIGLGSVLPDRIPERVPTEGRPVADEPRGPLSGGATSDSAALTDGAKATLTTSDADATLWGVLSSEERGFYLRHALRGQATYGPNAGLPATTTPGARLGARIDMRV